jgi:hypothetical protein
MSKGSSTGFPGFGEVLRAEPPRPRWSESFLRQELAEGRARIQERRAMRRLVEAGEPFRVPERASYGRGFIVVHRSTVTRGHWQASYFDEGGEATGDSPRRTLAEAVEAARDNGGDMLRATPLRRSR